MPIDPKTTDQIKAMVRDLFLDLRKIIKDVDQGDDFLQVVCLFLHAIISTVADLVELSNPGAKHYILSDIEEWTGGLRAFHESGVDYQVPNIKPDDSERAMNYLGKAIHEALFRGLFTLPKSLQNEEMILSSTEAFLANLLNQICNNPGDISDNPHDVLDILSEHVHMCLDDLQKSRKLH